MKKTVALLVILVTITAARSQDGKVSILAIAFYHSWSVDFSHTCETVAPYRLVFTNDGVGVGVVIRSAERYDLVKIKQTESEEEYRCRLRLRRLRSSEN